MKVVIGGCDEPCCPLENKFWTSSATRVVSSCVVQTEKSTVWAAVNILGWGMKKKHLSIIQ